MDVDRPQKRVFSFLERVASWGVCVCVSLRDAWVGGPRGGGGGGGGGGIALRAQAHRSPRGSGRARAGEGGGPSLGALFLEIPVAAEGLFSPARGRRTRARRALEVAPGPTAGPTLCALLLIFTYTFICCVFITILSSQLSIFHLNYYINIQIHLNCHNFTIHNIYLYSFYYLYDRVKDSKCYSTFLIGTAPGLQFAFH